MPTLPEKVDAVLVAAFAGPNTGLPDGSPNRISVYRSVIPGVPSNRYAVNYAGDPRRENSTVDGRSRDAVGRFQITVAASRPESLGSPAGETNRLVRAVLDAFVDLRVTDVDGLGAFVIQQDDVDTFPVPVEVVADRVTVEHALLFKYLADRI
jgi:hypothetical protein